MDLATVSCKPCGRQSAHGIAGSGGIRGSGLDRSALVRARSGLSAACVAVLLLSGLQPACAHDAATKINPAQLLSSQPETVLPDSGGEVRLDLTLNAPQRVRTRRGAVVHILANSSRSEELHLHGYDQTLRTQPGQTVRMTVQAKRSGRFELETHAGHRTVLVLEVMP